MRLAFLVTFLFILSGCAPKQPETSGRQCITPVQLSGYSYNHLSKVAQLLREDTKKVDEFSGFVTTLKISVNNYSSIIQSSVYLSNAVRFLPIPYAGEASSFTKVFSGTLLHLNSAAMALDNYKKSSAQFLAVFDKIDKANATPDQLLKLSTFADTTLMNDARNLQISLEKISSSAATLASTAQSISNAMDTTGGYFNQAKSFVGMTPETNDKKNISEGGNSLHTRIAQFSQKIAALEHSEETHRLHISKARTYAELAQQVNLN